MTEQATFEGEQCLCCSWKVDSAGTADPDERVPLCTEDCLAQYRFANGPHGTGV